MREKNGEGAYLGVEAVHFSMSEYVERIASDLAKVSPSNLPDFLVLSPPRTGTTWIARALNAHKDIFIPPEKEVRYFDVGWRFSDIAYYLDRYSAADGRLKGDASPSYVLLPLDIIRLLHHVKPSMKFIVVVRDLESRAWSNFRHSYAIGEFGLHGGVTFQGLVPEEKVLNYLVSDYSLSVGDYREYLSRWLECFPVDQFFVAGIAEAEREPSALLKRLYRFLGVACRVGVPLAVESKINAGLGAIARTDNINQLLTVLYGARQQYQDRFLQKAFGFRAHHSDVRSSKVPPLVELVNRADGYKVFVWNGKFHACVLEDFSSVRAALAKSTSVESSHLVANYYSDIVFQIEQRKRGTVARLTQKKREDVRLLAVINALADDYVASNSLRTNLGAARILREHRGFNVVAFAGAVIALRQSLGPVELGGADLAGLLAKCGADNVVIGYSLVDVIKSIDLLIEQGVAEKKVEPPHVDLVERLKAIQSEGKLQFQELRKRDEALACNLTSLASNVQRDLEGIAKRDAEGLSEFKSRQEQLRDAGAARLEGELHNAARRIDVGLTELGSRLELRQDSIAAHLEGELRNAVMRGEEDLTELDSRLQQGQQELAQRLSLIAPEDVGAPRMLLEDYYGFNLIASVGKIWAVDMNAGEVNLEDTAKRDELATAGILLAAETVDGARLAVLSRHIAQVNKAFEKRLSLVAPLSNGETRLLVEDYRGYNLLASEDRVWALDVSVGEVDCADTKRIKGLSASGHLLVADTLDGARIAVLSHELTRSNAAMAERISTIVPDADSNTVLLEQDYRGYNLLAYAGRAWALEMLAGEIDLANDVMVKACLADGRLLFAASIDGVRSQVDRLLDQRVFAQSLGHFGETVETNLNTLTSRLEARLEEAARRSDDRLGELQARLLAVEKLIGEEIKALSEKVEDIARKGAQRINETLVHLHGLEASSDARIKILSEGVRQGLQEAAQTSDDNIAKAEIRLQALLDERIKRVSDLVERGFYEASTESGERLGELQGRLKDLFEERLKDVSGSVESCMADAARTSDQRLSETQARLAALSGRIDSGLREAAGRSEEHLNEMASRLEQSQQLTVLQLEARLAELERTWWQRLVNPNTKSKGGQ